ncbi:MAG: succinyl-diaminopimelate desuccinylase [Thermomicrobiales bacterium]|nr:MAG: succinyl-diaminopimelate desuccinylase [Thermomicrobiales bacterium]
MHLDPEIARHVLAQIDESETIALLRRLIQVPSVNPPGDVREAVAVCEEPLRSAGFSTRIAQLVPEKPNLIAELGTDSGPILCLNAHVDVVPTGALSAWTHPPFAADIVDGRVYGRGAGDDKASVAAQVMAGVALARAGVPLAGRLVITTVADEEVGGPAGAALLINQRLVTPDFVIVGEQTRNRVCVGEKGFASTRVTVHGRAAHGALPWEGANAIEAMGKVIVALSERLWPLLAQRAHPSFHPSSASINLIHGGVKENVVPDRCSIYIDRRLIPGEDPATAIAEIERVARDAVANLAGIHVTVEPEGEQRRATINPPDAPVVQAMVAANRFLGLSTDLTGFSMATDGRFFADAGYPTIIYGPGDPAVAHIPDEWVGVDEVLAATRAYALAAVALLGSAASQAS